MTIKDGTLYFISDCFFEKVRDDYLKMDYDKTKRPHYLAFQDERTLLYWLVPCSSRIEKYERIIAEKQSRRKPTDGIKIIRIRDQKSVLLFQDMFPATAEYVLEPYMKSGMPVYIESQKVVAELKRTAKEIRNKLRIGIRFTPTQPDVIRIEQLMLEELQRQEPVRQP